jgi:hypothetical protein
MDIIAQSPKFGGAILLIILFTIIAIIICEVIAIFIFAPDWASIRCIPYVMPFAGLFGQDVNKNFQFCMSEAFSKQAGETIGPLYKFFGGFIGVLSSLVDTTNSIRLSFATFMGGFITIISEFNDRFRMFMSQVQLSGQRLKMLMYRIYATFYAMIYMALSSIRAVNNFGGTVLFGFLDTFCFDPNTPVYVRGRGEIRIEDVQLGDILCSETQVRSKVTSVFRFMADGQPMVSLGGITVSTNHYVSHAGKWIRAADHPDALPVPHWNGGSKRPLICFNTHNNCIPIGKYTFRDYDEAPAGVEDGYRWINQSLNAGIGGLCSPKSRKWTEMTPAFDPAVQIVKKDGTFVAAKDICLGDMLQPTGDVVTGVIETAIYEYIEMSGDKFTPSTLFWHEVSGTWQRLGDIYPHLITTSETPLIFRSLIVLSGSRIQCKSGLIIRDYMEVASPWAEEPYSRALSSLA